MTGPPPPHFTWRVLGFLVAVVVIIGLTVAAITYYARDTYFIGFNGDTVAIYRGRPGGVLWIKPELVESTGIPRSSVPDSFMDDIGNGKLEPTLADAHKYLTNVRDVASSQSPGDGTDTTAPGSATTTTLATTTTGA